MSLLNLPYIIGLNSVTFGLELCASAAFVYIPPMLLKTGFSEGWMSFIMSLGPIFALLTVPFIGFVSDHCQSKYGRRRPFIFWLCVGIAVSLLFIPYGHVLGAASQEENGSWKRTMGILILALAVTLLDFCIQVCYTPLETLLSDNCNDTSDQNRMFTMFSFTTSVGSCLGYWLISVDWSGTSLGLVLGGQAETVFAILFTSFVITATLTLLLARDIPLSLGNSVLADSNHIISTTNLENLENGTKKLQLPMSGHSSRDDPPNNPLNNNLPTRTVMMPLNRILNCLHIILSPVHILVCWLPSCLIQVLPKSCLKSVKDTFHSLQSMPIVLYHLFVAHFLTCTAVMGLKLFYSDFIAESFYGGNPEAPEQSEIGKIYDEGVRMGSWGLLLHGIVSAVYSVLLETVIRLVGIRLSYLFGMMSFAFAMVIMLFNHNLLVMNSMAALSGFAAATVTALPYILLSEYQKSGDVSDNIDSDSLGAHGKGTDIAILDCAYLLSETVAALVFGLAVDYTKLTHMYIVCSAIFATLGFFAIFRVKFSS